MTISSNGYSGGSVDTVAWATLSPHSGAAPHLLWGLAASVTSAVNRTVQVAIGEAQGWGILDNVTLAEVLTFDSASSTTPRWDAIVLHRDWQAGATSLDIVKGTTNSATQVYPSALQLDPGVVADQVLHLVPVTNTGVGTPVPIARYAAGSTLYIPSGTVTLDAAQFDYGQTLVQFQAAGIQNRVLLRRGSFGSEVFDDLNSPDWQTVQPFSGVSVATGGQECRMRVAGGHLEIAGELTRTGGFTVGGGVDGDWDIAPVAAGMRPDQTRFVGSSCRAANLEVRFDKPTSRIKVRVYNATAPYLFLDGIRFPLH